MHAIDAIQSLEKEWKESSRWKDTLRPYSAEEVVKLRPSVHIEYSLAKIGAKKFWDILSAPSGYVNALGTLTGAQAVNMVKAGLKAIYMSGWQVAADANLSGQTYPDQSLYPSNSVPALVKRILAALLRADQIDRLEGSFDTDWIVPILADAEAGFGGPLHSFELMKMMIEAGASAVHFEDQLASEKKCGHLGGKVLLPTSHFIKTLVAARLASDVCGVPTCLVARTDALGAQLMTSDIDSYDAPFITGERTSEGFYRIRDGIQAAVARGLAYAPYADALWFETSTPDLDEAKEFAKAIHAKFPGKALAYNCSPSFNWEKHLDKQTIARFQRDLGDMGYKFQFITLAGWHLLNYYTFDLASGYKETGMSAYVDLQNKEFARAKDGYTAARHQREVGTGYFDRVLMTVTRGESSTSALKGSTEEEQFDGNHMAHQSLNRQGAFANKQTDV